MYVSVPFHLMKGNQTAHRSLEGKLKNKLLYQILSLFLSKNHDTGPIPAVDFYRHFRAPFKSKQRLHGGKNPHEFLSVYLNIAHNDRLSQRTQITPSLILKHRAYNFEAKKNQLEHWALDTKALSKSLRSSFNTHFTKLDGREKNWREKDATSLSRFPLSNYTAALLKKHNDGILSVTGRIRLTNVRFVFLSANMNTKQNKPTYQCPHTELQE